MKERVKVSFKMSASANITETDSSCFGVADNQSFVRNITKSKGKASQIDHAGINQCARMVHAQSFMQARKERGP